MFGDEKIGLLLLITHFIASLTVGILFRFYKKYSISDIISQDTTNSNSINLSNIGLFMGNAIQKSISTILLIGGYIVFFAVLNEIFSITLFKDIENPVLLGLLNGLLEITSGIKKLSQIDSLSLNNILPLVALILGFGGFSVHMQVASILSESKLSMKPYLLGKLLQGIFAYIYTRLLISYTSFFNFEIISAFNYYMQSPSIINESFNIFRTLVFLIIFGILIKLIYKLIKILYLKTKKG